MGKGVTYVAFPVFAELFLRDFISQVDPAKIKEKLLLPENYQVEKVQGIDIHNSVHVLVSSPDVPDNSIVSPHYYRYDDGKVELMRIDLEACNYDAQQTIPTSEKPDLVL